MATNLKSENKDGILFIYCAGDLGAAFVSDAIPLVQKEPPDSYRAVGLELLACADITDSNAFRTIAVLAKTLKSQDKKLFALYANSKVASAIRDHGLDLAVPLLDSEDFIPQILAKPPPPVTKIDVEFINPFINGAIMTLDMQCTLKATPGKPFLKGSGPVEVVTEIAGIIGLVSPHFNGSIAICFPKELFLSIMSTMLGEKFDTITKDLEDGAAELLNIIFGSAKRVLNEKGYALEKATPTIVRGPSLTVRHMTPNPTIVLPFTTPSGAFQIEIATEAVATTQ